MQNKLTKGFLDRRGGDPIKGMGCFSVLCGICPCITSIVCTIVFGVLLIAAAEITANWNKADDTDFNWYDHCGEAEIVGTND